MADIVELLAQVVRDHPEDMYDNWCDVCGPAPDEDGYADHIAKRQAALLPAAVEAAVVAVMAEHRGRPGKDPMCSCDQVRLPGLSFAAHVATNVSARLRK